jgi:hypothetical protein
MLKIVSSTARHLVCFGFGYTDIHVLILYIYIYIYNIYMYNEVKEFVVKMQNKVVLENDCGAFLL